MFGRRLLKSLICNKPLAQMSTSTAADYMKFLELVGNVKVRKIKNFATLYKTRKEKIRRDRAYEFSRSSLRENDFLSLFSVSLSVHHSFTFH